MALHVALLVETEFLRLVLRQLLRRSIGAEVVAEAATPAQALAFPPIGALVADVEACLADPSGFTALCQKHPGRIVLIGQGEMVAAPGLNIPASVIRVPMGGKGGAQDLAVLTAGLAEALRPLLASATTPKADPAPPAVAPSAPRGGRVLRPALILVAASTGGPEALQEMLAALRPPPCPLVIALHIPAEHCAGLVRHLAGATGHAVTLGTAGRLPAAGVVLLQGGMDHQVVMRGDGLWLREAAAANSVFHPNGDVLLGSGAALDCAVVGVILTGMGSDGRAGALALAARGRPVLAQTPASCAVAGMPAASIAAGAVREVASPSGIAARLNDWFALPALR
ncbi:two-component system chemotaxis response regulator CheB [Humitalea rosea]|uniref:protein-glutamate methylesterase n=2 Tax=Humitalea rosea TaxID=990373 RepID=A0A2W7IJ82_9PROT|nr:two-component system chemotaxis response regulator CheB [Humitalea rosea]